MNWGLFHPFLYFVGMESGQLIKTEILLSTQEWELWGFIFGLIHKGFIFEHLQPNKNCIHYICMNEDISIFDSLFVFHEFQLIRKFENLFFIHFSYFLLVLLFINMLYNQMAHHKSNEIHFPCDFLFFIISIDFNTFISLPSLCVRPADQHNIHTSFTLCIGALHCIAYNANAKSNA